NDGDLDLFVANGEPEDGAQENNSFYVNNGDGTFNPITAGPLVNDGGSSNSCSWADYDNDARLDLFVTNNNATSPNFLYHNKAGSNKGLNITCTGIVSNTLSIGARVNLWSNGNVQMQEIGNNPDGRSLNLEFGLQNRTIVDSLVIEWNTPTDGWPDGIERVFPNIDVNIDSFLTIAEVDPPLIEVSPPYFMDETPAPGASFPLEGQVPIEGETIQIEAAIESVTPPDVTLIYGKNWQSSGQGAIIDTILTSGRNEFDVVFEIPGSAVTSEGLWYRIRAVNEADTAYYPAEWSRQSIIVRIEDSNSFRSIEARGAFPDGLPTTDWYTVSLPFFSYLSLADEKVFGQQNFNDQGQPTNWRVGSLDSESETFVDIDEMLNLRGYVASHRLDQNPYFTPDSALTSRFDEFDELVLESGFNLVSWPHTFSATLVAADSLIQDQIWKHSGQGWGQVVIGDEFRPFVGYLIYSWSDSTNRLGDLIEVNPIDPNAATAMPSGQRKRISKTEGEWRIRFMARAGLRRDNFNFVGTSAYALNNLDYRDVCEPPGIGDYLSLYFQYPDTITGPTATTSITKLAFDIRSDRSMGHTWLMAVENKTAEPSVTLHWEMTGLPVDYRFVLVDISNNLFVESMDTYHFQTGR
ncbi:MAG: CRTAC1 family protein, partial [Planctomycetes bacterium]|nr:CRTAC1 family protein [Planctomycetota bacterium]